MRKISKRFDEVWSKAEERNRKNGQRYIKIFESRKRYLTMGIYDSKTKKYCLFDTLNLIGNFRYNAKEVPAEFEEMWEMIE